MKQWCALYVGLYSYEFVIWLDCFVRHSCPGGISPETGPLSLTCSITTMLGTLLTIDTIYALISIFVRRSVPGRLVSTICLHKARSLRQGLCIPHAGFPLARKHNSNRGWPGSNLIQARGHLTWRIIGWWWSGMLDSLISTYIIQFMGVCHRQNTLWP